MVLVTTHHQAEANVSQELATLNVPSDVVTQNGSVFKMKKLPVTTLLPGTQEVTHSLRCIGCDVIVNGPSCEFSMYHMIILLFCEKPQNCKATLSFMIKESLHIRWKHRFIFSCSFF